ncbi:shikimate kinase [Brumimicrobium aurantiacum]|uniref:Shikimate kinase n=1 Tax=Brumimicrobium aurantiacum TaxID=1737063 RepID=A0A3E1EUF9_9FLAO|nr:shikimate kinase [Brumimicrobium aurantiacum]RFC53199.1 AAA family ATPase [Brumimicrobium aurantiacum]
MQKNLVFLIGFMGVGKTTLGKKIAKKLEYTFVDIDQKIESKFKISINEFFNKYGETTFRKEETKMLESIISEENNAIISVGGGLPCFNGNMELMNKSGVTCYLKRPPKELYHRLVNGKGNRPLLKELNDEELLLFIENKLNEREMYYNQARFVFLRDRQSVENLVEELNL